MNMMSLRSFTPPPKKLTSRQLLDELVRTGHRPYICTDPGSGVVHVWATSAYKEKDLEGEVGFNPETWNDRWIIPTKGLVPDEKASMQRVSIALDCDSVRQRPISPALEALLGSSFQLVTDDFDRLLLKPLGGPNEAKT